VCGYGCEIVFEDWGKVINSITASVPDDVLFSYGLIEEEKVDKDRFTVYLIAICSGTAG
jgi:hypothetical protein